MKKVCITDLLSWLDSLPEKEKESIIALYNKELLRKKEPQTKPKLKLRKQVDSVHPAIQKVLNEIEDFKQAHYTVIQKWQELEDRLHSVRADLNTKWKEYWRG